MIGLFVTHHFDLQQHEEKVKKGEIFHGCLPLYQYIWHVNIQIKFGSRLVQMYITS